MRCIIGAATAPNALDGSSSRGDEAVIGHCAAPPLMGPRYGYTMPERTLMRTDLSLGGGGSRHIGIWTRRYHTIS